MVLVSRVPQNFIIQCSNCGSFLEVDLSSAGQNGAKQDEVECYTCKHKNVVTMPSIEHLKISGTSPRSTPAINTGVYSNPIIIGKGDSTQGSSPGPSFPKSASSTGEGAKRSAGETRGKGTDESPLETEYYEWLEVSPTATASEIKKKYYILALSFHPDKNPDPNAEDRFKQISEAYQVLSDPAKRREYNQHGAKRDGVATVDPMSFFNQLFGGERFVDMIGNLNIISELGAVAEQAEEEAEAAEASGAAAPGTPGAAATTGSTGGSGTSVSAADKSDKAAKKKRREEYRKRAEEQEKQNEERVAALVEKLKQRLQPVVEATEAGEEAALAAFADRVRQEAEDLKTESLGVELLNVIGRIYLFKANKHLDRQEIFGGVRGVFSSFKETGQIIGGAYTTIKAAIDLQRTFAELSRAEEKGLSAEERQALEESAVRKGLAALWKGGKLEIESVLREVCDKTLHDPTAPKPVRRRRAIALRTIGTIYENVTQDPDMEPHPFMPQFV